MTDDDLSKIKQEILLHYRDNDYPLVTVTVPAGQDISTGRVYMVVMMAKLGKIRVENAEHFEEARGDVTTDDHLCVFVTAREVCAFR